LILAIGVAGVQLCLDGNVFATPQEDIMEEIMEEIMDDISEDINDSIKEEVRAETNEVVAETTSSPFSLSGTYISSFGGTFTYVISGSSFHATIIFTSPTFLFTQILSGTIAGNNTSFTVNQTETVVGVGTCTESGFGTGVFSGSGEPGTTHTIMLPGLCGASSDFTTVHTKQ